MTTILGAMIRRRRHELGLTQEELEELSGVAQHYQSQIELGKARPGDDILRALADGLQVPFSRLVLARSGAEPVEEGDEHEVTIYRRTAMRGDGYVRVSSEMLGSRAPETCFVVEAPDASLRDHFIRCGDCLLFARLASDELPHAGEIVARQDADRWTLFVWHMDAARPDGRLIAMWRTAQH